MSKLNKVSPHEWQLTGALDRHTLPPLWSELNQLPGPGELSINLKQLERIDSAGLAGLLRLQTNAELVGLSLTFVNAPEQTIHLAQMSNVANMLSLS